MKPSTTTEKNKLAVVRGIGARYHEAVYYARFKKFEVNFLTNKAKSSFADVSSSLRIKQLKFKPACFINPINIFGKRINQRSWAKLDKLEENLEDADIIDTYETFHFFSSQCAEFAKRVNKPLITNIWMNVPNHPVKLIPPYSFNVKKVVENSTFFILRTQKAADYLLSLGVSPNKMEVIYMGIDLSKFKLANQDKRKIRLLFVGELVPSKGLDDLLTAFPKLTKNHSNLELWVVGEGRLAKRVVALSEQLPIKYFGFLPPIKLPQVYQQCQIFCLPSRDIKYFAIAWIEEMFGYVFVEAMASGLPIVSTHCGAISEVVGEDNLLVPQGDVEKLATALESLIKDERGRKEIGASNRRRSEKFFDLQQQAEKTENLLGRFV